MTKLTVRLDETEHAAIKDEAKTLGMSVNEYLLYCRRAVTKNQPKLDLTEVNKLKGEAASALILGGTNYTVSSIWGRNTRLVVAEGYLWHLKPTSNWSGRELVKLCPVPKCLLERCGAFLDENDKEVTDWLGKYLKNYKLNWVIDMCFVITELEGSEWFKSTWRKLQVVSHCLDFGWSAQKLTEEFDPNYGVTTEPVLSQEEVVEAQPEVTELPVRAKASQLQALYGLQKTWHQVVGTFKQLGFQAPDGNVWTYQQSNNFWVRS